MECEKTRGLSDMKQIGFIGAGSIAEAMIKGMLQKKVAKPEHIFVTNHANQARLEQLQRDYNIQICSKAELGFMIDQIETIVLAFKPKDLVPGLAQLKECNLEGKCIVSVLAGVPTKLIEDELQVKGLSVIRAMPNTSSAVGESATALTRGRFVREVDFQHVVEMFQAVGLVEEVQEVQMDAITGLSGSGPAYVYYMIEALVDAGIQLGLEKEMAKRLVYQTVVGAARMLQEASEEPAELRRQITSPNGTTMAGISILSNLNFQQSIIEAVWKACERSKELGEIHQQTVSYES